MGLDVSWLKFYHFSEMLDGLFQSILLFQCTAKIKLSHDKIRSIRNSPAEQAFSLVNPFVLQCDSTHQSQCINIRGIVTKHLLVHPLGFVQATGFLVFGRESQLLPFRIQFK